VRGGKRAAAMEAAAPPAGRIVDPEREGPLRRAITRRMLFFFILGDILGAGIYALVGAVAGEVGGAV
jgi:APA family basic amino acid/polyamine antiporter